MTESGELEAQHGWERLEQGMSVPQAAWAAEQRRWGWK